MWSARMFAFKSWELGDSDIDVTRLPNDRRAASTTCGGFAATSIFERITGKAAEVCSGARNAGPPIEIQQNPRSYFTMKRKITHHVPDFR
jgi:hypothetical protein